MLTVERSFWRVFCEPCRHNLVIMRLHTGSHLLYFLTSNVSKYLTTLLCLFTSLWSFQSGLRVLRPDIFGFHCNWNLNAGINVFKFGLVLEKFLFHPAMINFLFKFTTNNGRLFYLSHISLVVNFKKQNMGNCSFQTLK